MSNINSSNVIYLKNILLSTLQNRLPNYKTVSITG